VKRQLHPVLFLACLLALGAAGCGPSSSRASGPLPQRGYLWQRNWSPAVIPALTAAGRRLRGVVLLGAEIEWAGQKPQVVRPKIDWERLKRTPGGRYSIALRVAPFAIPPNERDPVLRSIDEVAKSLLREAGAHEVKLEEFQLDYDCAEKSLANYRGWIHRLRGTLGPTRFVITTLPAWSEKPEFAALVGEVDGYILQVHSVPFLNAGSRTLCDPATARRWVAKAAQLHRPFSVALPTYRCTAGYNRAGKLIGVAMDAVQPSWPPDTRRLEFAADADRIAGLVREWEDARPAELQEILWYRIPVATDARNWRWPTLAAVMSGRKPRRHFAVKRAGENPVDLALVNDGETDDDLRARVVASWPSGVLVAADALPGWKVESQPRQAIFTVGDAPGIRLPPGSKRSIGWLRYAAPVRLAVTCGNENETTR
jgi:hypothetical protein